jgi:catechol 2,3-dioxygenase-like lactoylglutathione lyase family enzyme
MCALVEWVSRRVLGRFLEFSLTTPDVRASLDFYSRLGFSQAEVGETWQHPYAVVTDGRIHLGLHQQEVPGPVITFVKPDLLKSLQPIEALGVMFEYRRLGNDVFNEVGWLDPSGQGVRMIEARTFSPSKRLTTQLSACGYFLEIALPTPNIEAAKFYWEQFGFVGIDDAEDLLPHVSCTSDTVDLGLYDHTQLRRPALRFEVDDLPRTRAELAAIGMLPDGNLQSRLRPAAVLAFTAPEGTPILLTTA